MRVLSVVNALLFQVFCATLAFARVCFACFALCLNMRMFSRHACLNARSACLHMREGKFSWGLLGYARVFCAVLACARVFAVCLLTRVLCAMRACVFAPLCVCFAWFCGSVCLCLFAVFFQLRACARV